MQNIANEKHCKGSIIKRLLVFICTKLYACKSGTTVDTKITVFFLGCSTTSPFIILFACAYTTGCT